MSAALASFYKLAAYVDNYVLVAGAAQTINAPTGYQSCVITPTDDMWVRRGGGAAADPAANVTDGTGSIFIPKGQSRIIDLRADLPSGTDITSFSAISTPGCDFSLEWFR